MPVGALIAGGIGAIGSIGSSMIGASAAKDASAAQTAMGQQALAQQQGFGQQGIDMLKQMFGIAQGTVQPVINAGMNLASGPGMNVLNQGGDLRTAGQGIINRGTGIIDPTAKTLSALLTPGANMSAMLAQMPGFQFAQDWGQKAVQNIGTTTGLGGNTLKAGADYATGVAQQGYGNIVQQLQALLAGGTNVLNSGISQQGIGNQLSGIGGNLIGTGFGAASGSANALAGSAINAGNSAFGNLNQLGKTTGDTMTGIGNAQASGVLGTANAYMGGIQGGTNALSNSYMLSKLLGGGSGGGGGIYTTGGVPSSNLLTGGIGSA